MKLNVKQNVYGPGGELIDKKKDEPWKLGDILVLCIGTAPVKEKTLFANFERYDLAEKIKKAKKYVEFTIDEAQTVQDCLVKSEAFGPFVVAAAGRLMEGCCGPDEDEVVTRKPAKKKKGKKN